MNFVCTAAATILLLGCGPSTENLEPLHAHAGFGSGGSAGQGGSAAEGGSGGDGDNGDHPWDEAILNVVEIAKAAKAHYDLVGERCGSSDYTDQWIHPDPQPYEPGDKFSSGDASDGWACLGWQPSQAILRYRYFYTRGVGLAFSNPQGPSADGFEALACGDLDADGKTSMIAMAGDLVWDTMTLAPEVYLQDEAE